MERVAFLYHYILIAYSYGMKDKRKDAVRKVIAAMTVGKDVSSLFTDVVNCMQTENLELKKLVYLYLINYAKSQPDLAILAVNTFVKVRIIGKVLHHKSQSLPKLIVVYCSRTHKTQIRSFVHWLYERWDAFVLIKLQSIFVIPSRDVLR